ncbi:hypothetical protein [Natrinema sp. 74]|uniref:hypothetical protein n=1 Tax=Natrinema sp. 74 TaxID=3384159 RepID=UPI0038D47491
MRSATPTWFERAGRGESTIVIVAMGLALAIGGIVRTLETPASQPVVAFELFVSLLVPTGLATGGYWLASRNVSSDVRWRAVTQVSIGIVVACALAVWLTGYVTLEGGAIRDPLSLTTTLAPVGGAAGFVTAVRERPDVASAESTDPTAGDGTALPNTQTPAAASDTTDTSDPAATAKGSAAVWNDTDPVGRTAAPVCPLQPSDGTVTDDSDFDAFDASARDASADSVDPRDSLTETRDPGVDAVATVPSTAETVLEVCRNEHARLALAVLYHEWNGEARSVDALARAVSSHTDDSTDTVAVGLRHTTLPELREIRAVDWDPHTDRVSASDHAVFEEGVREASVVLESFEPGTR